MVGTAGAPTPPVAVSPDGWSPGDLAPVRREGRGAAPPQGEPGRCRYFRATPPGRHSIPAPPMRPRRRRSVTPVQREPEQQLRVVGNPAKCTQRACWFQGGCRPRPARRPPCTESAAILCFLFFFFFFSPGQRCSPQAAP
ncbi:hypothetical protein NDU88_003864 [Pleurodeles waltl]|uniref:Uncharacterized protein n=1 Tax=Pleurodeles waltl TaxID=8319 RepID=A0AAV7TQ69_PLEWA|nr:hypothetical protein NDU88_003864 [Pleurodeles waltl]